MDYRISLEQMHFRAFHGCYDLEQKVGNRFTVDLDITTSLGEIARVDSVDQAVNYLTAYEVVQTQMDITQRTLERVAMNIIDALRATFPQITHIQCRVAKLAPPLGGKIECVSVTLSS